MANFRLREEVKAIQYNGLNFDTIQQWMAAQIEKVTITNRISHLTVFTHTNDLLNVDMNGWIAVSGNVVRSYTNEEFQSLFVRI